MLSGWQLDPALLVHRCIYIYKTYACSTPPLQMFSAWELANVTWHGVRYQHWSVSHLRTRTPPAAGPVRWCDGPSERS